MPKLCTDWSWYVLFGSTLTYQDPCIISRPSRYDPRWLTSEVRREKIHYLEIILDVPGLKRHPHLFYLMCIDTRPRNTTAHALPTPLHTMWKTHIHMHIKIKKKSHNKKKAPVGIEPTFPDYKTGVLPIKLKGNNTITKIRMVGLEPTSIEPKSTMLPIAPHSLKHAWWDSNP